MKLDIGIMSILGIIFIVLKLTHVINWSWWLVALPLYGQLIILIIIFGIFSLLKNEN